MKTGSYWSYKTLKYVTLNESTGVSSMYIKGDLYPSMTVHVVTEQSEIFTRQITIKKSSGF